MFGGGSRNTVAIFIGVKDPSHTGPATIHYRDVGDYLTRDDKLRILDTDPLPTIDWATITPNTAGDWINQRDDTFSKFPAIGRKDGAGTGVFDGYSRGLATARDAWCYNASKSGVEGNMRRMIDFYNQQVFDFAQTKPPSDRKERAKAVDKFIDNDPTKISWNRGTKQDLARGVKYEFRSKAVRLGSYRPFEKRWVYFDRKLNDMVYKLPTMFPTPDHANIGFYVVGTGSDKQFSALMTRGMPDLSFWGSGSGQFFPRYTYRRPDGESGILDFSTGEDEVDEWGYQRVDNITDEIASVYRSKLGDDVSKDDIFCFVYGLLHSPTYRVTYAADLKKMLPRIPTPESRAEFDTRADAGRQLVLLHADYDEVDPFPLDVSVKKGHDPDDPNTWRVQKMKWRSKTDHSTIVYNPCVTIAGIPEEAERYLLGSRTALGWIIERYQVKTDKDSKIINDPNDWCDEHDDPTYIVDLIRKVTTVAVETMKIVDGLP